jgi:hypothetical protein
MGGRIFVPWREEVGKGHSYEMPRSGLTKGNSGATTGPERREDFEKYLLLKL